MSAIEDQDLTHAEIPTDKPLAKSKEDSAKSHQGRKDDQVGN